MSLFRSWMMVGMGNCCSCHFEGEERVEVSPYSCGAKIPAYTLG